MTTPIIEAGPEEIYDIELEHSLLEANAKLARQNRALLDEHGVTAVDVMGAIGSGKTTLITRLVGKFKDRFGVAVFNGDATTANDTDGIADQGVPVVQLATINGCHLDANLVGKALQRVDLEKLDLILIENIGNLICPAEFPLGSRSRVVVVRRAESPLKRRKAMSARLKQFNMSLNSTLEVEAPPLFTECVAPPNGESQAHGDSRQIAKRLQELIEQIQAHGGNIELFSLENEVARIKLQGTCKTCPSSTITLELNVPRAVEEACPDLFDFEVVDGAGEPLPTC